MAAAGGHGEAAPLTGLGRSGSWFDGRLVPMIAGMAVNGMALVQNDFVN